MSYYYGREHIFLFTVLQFYSFLFFFPSDFCSIVLHFCHIYSPPEENTLQGVAPSTTLSSHWVSRIWILNATLPQGDIFLYNQILIIKGVWCPSAPLGKASYHVGVTALQQSSLPPQTSYFFDTCFLQIHRQWLPCSNLPRVKCPQTCR